MTSAPTVDIEFVKKQMLEKKRCVYFIEGVNNDVLAYNDDADKKLEAAIAEMEENLLSIQGKFVFVRLHAKAPGGGNPPGGKPQNILRYRVLLNQAVQQQNNGTQFGGNLNNGMFAVFQGMMQQMADMRVEMIQTKFEAQIEALKKEKKDVEQDGKAPLVDMFLNRVEKRIVAYEQKQELLTKGKKVAEGAQLASDASQHEPGTVEIMQGLVKLKELDPDFVNSFKLFVEYAEANPLLYKGLIDGIKNEKQAQA